ncbi:MAG: outer membrane beta-barrel family protein [Cyclobacteriaceae bacterium]
MKFTISFYTLLFLSHITFALEFSGNDNLKPQISGSLLDETTKEPLSYATVSLLSLPDSTLVDGVITDDNGAFVLNPPLGSYILKAQFVTFQNVLLPVTLDKKNKVVDVGVLSMKPSTKELEEVIVQGERTQMELSLDKKVYNVGTDLSSLGGSASDILANLPSVAVDVEGNVELRGSTSVRILINGKPSGLVGLSSADALRQLQGNLIESVEIITNPSARYDAEGQAGIINIILKKEQSKGVNGSFLANTGAPHNHGVGINMNFRRDKINFFVNYGFNYDRAPGESFTNQKFTLSDTTYYTDQENSRLRGGFSNNLRFGADFNIGENSTLTTSFLYRYSIDKNMSDLSFSDYDENRRLIAYSLREDEENEVDKNLEYSINYEKQFKRKGHTLAATVQYQDNFENEISDISETIGPDANTIDNTIFQKIDNKQGEDQLLLQVDYIQPFGSKAKVELGYRTTVRTIINNYLVEEQNEAGMFVPLDSFTFDFEYNENVHAFYGIVSDELDKFSWQAGLRAEISDIDVDQRNAIDGKAFFNYTNFFPSAFLTYKLTTLSQLQASYSRRINRPRYRDLSPLGSFTNNRTFRLGNPDLQPEYTDSYELGLLQNFDQASIYYGVYYRKTDDPIQRVSPPADAEGLIYSRPQNLGSEESFGIEVNANKDFTEWYRVSGNFNFFRQETFGSAFGEDLNAQTVTFTTRISNNFKFKEIVSGQININYRAPEVQPQGRREAITVIDLGMTKDLWKKKGTIALSVRDVFNSRKYRFTTDTNNFTSDSEFQWRRGPQFVLTLNYRLNQDLAKRGERGDKSGYDGGSGEDF